jgi:hypothetical protein
MQKSITMATHDSAFSGIQSLSTIMIDPVVAGGATAAVVIDGKNGALFGRGTTSLAATHLRVASDCLCKLLSSPRVSKRSSIVHNDVTSSRHFIRDDHNNVSRVEDGPVSYRNKRHKFSCFGSLSLRRSCMNPTPLPIDQISCRQHVPSVGEIATRSAPARANPSVALWAPRVESTGCRLNATTDACNAEARTAKSLSDRHTAGKQGGSLQIRGNDRRISITNLSSRASKVGFSETWVSS